MRSHYIAWNEISVDTFLRQLTIFIWSSEEVPASPSWLLAFTLTFNSIMMNTEGNENVDEPSLMTSKQCYVLVKL